jgi:Linear amide C-N hydrolases, choloylglycine hydrolase family
VRSRSLEHQRRCRVDRPQHGLARVHPAADRGTPRGRRRDGGALAGSTFVDESPLRWTSRNGSLVTTIGVGSIDGVNERGLGVHGLYLRSTGLGRRDPSKPGLQSARWAQYLLSPNTIWIELDGLDFTEGAEPQAIDPYDESLSGNVTSRFTACQFAF